METKSRKPNALIEESSPYLLQHAYNPVQWHPWSEAALKKAREEDKLILVSIGYSACHWCHVMERECFEDALTAELMNEHFVCIKVDREERPDIDQLYMTAVHLMGGRGGWPLNVFTLPNGKPVYGGTYYPKPQWQKVLRELRNLYTEQRAEVEEYGERLSSGIRQSELFKVQEGSAIERNDLEASIERWKKGMDDVDGGPNRAPKFPLPNNYQALLRYAHLSGDTELMQHVLLTLDKMAMGGIYDQVGGGFARYSTDQYWKVPHFEKMLYDNGQLLSLYAEAALQSGKQRYREVVEETIEFSMRELRSPEGAFYSALDADSEGVEGKFYVWDLPTLQKELSSEEYNLLETHFFLDETGYWEHGQYVLMRRSADGSSEELKALMQRLLDLRSTRVRPGLDDKILLSWNAMMLRGLADSYRVFRDVRWLKLAEENLAFIRQNMMQENGELWHSWKNGKSSIQGFLEDYVWLIEALYGMYEATFEEEYLNEAVRLMYVTLSIFPTAGKGLLYYTSDRHGEWVARTLETSDNVIPASNSMLALNLYRLGLITGKPEWIARAEEMSTTVRNELLNYGPGYSNWMMLAFYKVFDGKELVVRGQNSKHQMQRIQQGYHPVLVPVAASLESSLFIARDRREDHWYLCREGACELPLRSVEEVIQALT